MAATFADTLVNAAGTAVSGADVIARPLQPGAVAMTPQWTATGTNGTFSLVIPSGVMCRLTVPAARIDHVLTPAAGDTITLESAKAGTSYTPGVAA